MTVAWDRDRYRQEVLEPARRGGGVPPPDLYARYGVRGDLLGDPAAFARRVADVTEYWRELTGNLSYQQLARALLAAHSALERDGPLTPVKLAAHAVAAHQEQTRRLARMAEAEAGSATHAGPDTVLRLRDALGGSVTESEVAGALSQAGVQVVSAFPELPAEPHAKQPDLARLTRQLGKRLSTEVVFGDAVRDGFRVLNGFRLADGRTLDEAALRAARNRTAALPFTDPAKAPVENVLAILGTAARRARGPRRAADVRSGGTAAAARRPRVPPAAHRPAGARLGLDENEAGLLAGALLTTNTLKEEDALRAQATEALHAGRLRAAQWLAAKLPAADPVADRIAAQDARVAALSREADEDLASGRRDRATARLSAAVEIAADDATLTERLIALPPPAPRNVEVDHDGQACPGHVGDRRGADRTAQVPGDAWSRWAAAHAVGRHGRERARRADPRGRRGAAPRHRPVLQRFRVLWRPHGPDGGGMLAARRHRPRGARTRRRGRPHRGERHRGHRFVAAAARGPRRAGLPL